MAKIRHSAFVPFAEEPTRATWRFPKTICAFEVTYPRTSTQRGDLHHSTPTITAKSSMTSELLSVDIPPELFKNILDFVGVEYRLCYNRHYGPFPSIHPTARREEMKHLSACALTCVYWAQLARPRMFALLVLRSSKDLSDLQSLLRAPQSPRISPIYDALQHLSLFYTLGDHPWFHNYAALKLNYRLSRLRWVNLHITSPPTPEFVAASARGSVLHPLFFAAPRVVPIVFLANCDLSILINGIHLPNPTILFNLLQDCVSLGPQDIDCANLTWNLDPVLQAIPSLVGLTYACRTELSFVSVSGCTDDVLVASMVRGAPRRDFARRREGPHLNSQDTSRLFDIMRFTWNGSSTKAKPKQAFVISSKSDFVAIQNDIPVRLAPGTDFCIEWEVRGFNFRSIASRLPDDVTTSHNIRNTTYITIGLDSFNDPKELREHMKTLSIGWDAFLHTVRQLPYLRQIVVQHGNHGFQASPEIHEVLVEFVAHLGQARASPGGLLGLSYRDRKWGEVEWVEVGLDTVMDEIEQKREEIKTEKATSRKLELSVNRESPNE